MAATRSAAEEVFHVPELLEQILLSVPRPVQLFALQRVSRTWQHTIKGSVSIRRRMCIEPPKLESAAGLTSWYEAGQLATNVIFQSKAIIAAIAHFRINTMFRIEETEGGPTVLTPHYTISLMGNARPSWKRQRFNRRSSLPVANLFDGFPCEASGSWREIGIGLPGPLSIITFDIKEAKKGGLLNREWTVDERVPLGELIEGLQRGTKWTLNVKANRKRFFGRSKKAPETRNLASIIGLSRLRCW